MKRLINKNRNVCVEPENDAVSLLFIPAGTPRHMSRALMATTSKCHAADLDGLLTWHDGDTVPVTTTSPRLHLPALGGHPALACFAECEYS